MQNRREPWQDVPCFQLGYTPQQQKTGRPGWHDWPVRLAWRAGPHKILNTFVSMGSPKIYDMKAFRMGSDGAKNATGFGMCKPYAIEKVPEINTQQVLGPKLRLLKRTPKAN